MNTIKRLALISLLLAPLAALSEVEAALPGFTPVNQVFPINLCFRASTSESLK